MSKKLSYVIEAAEGIRVNYSSISPFKPQSNFQKLKSFFFQQIIKCSEWILQRPIFFESKATLTDGISPSITKALYELIERQVIFSWYERPSQPGIPHIYHYTLDIEPVNNLHGNKVQLNNSKGEGTGFTKDEALIRAIAETIERHAVMNWSDSPPIFAKVDKDNISQAHNFLQNDYFHNREFLSWVPAKNLRGTLEYIPAALVYLGFSNNQTNESCIPLEITTNGVAAGSSYDMACANAMYETIERDSLFSYWLTKTPFKEIIPTTLPENLSDRISALLQRNIKIKIFDLDNDLGVPTYMALAFNKNGDRKVAMSAAAAQSSVLAIDKAINEVLKHLHVFSQNRLEIVDNQDIRTATMENFNYESIQNYFHKEVLLENQSYATDVQRYVSDAKKISFQNKSLIKDNENPNYREQFSALMAILKNNNVSGYICDVTDDMAKEFGLYVVRFLSQDFCQLYFSEAFRKEAANKVRKYYRSHGFVEAKDNVPIPFL